MSLEYCPTMIDVLILENNAEIFSFGQSDLLTLLTDDDFAIIRCDCYFFSLQTSVNTYFA